MMIRNFNFEIAPAVIFSAIYIITTSCLSDLLHQASILYQVLYLCSETGQMVD